MTMYKKLNFLAVVIAIPLLLTGCTNGSPHPLKTAVETPAPVVASNPISKVTIPVGQAMLGSNLIVKVSQVGEGYPTTDQVSAWKAQASNSKPPATASPNSSKASKLDDSKRIVALKYEVTNTGSSSINMKSFDPRSGYFEGITTISGDAGQVSDSDTSLHGLLGYASYPYSFNLSSSMWSLAPGATATWSMDWLIPAPIQEKTKVVLVQNFTVAQEKPSIGNKFTLTLIQPNNVASSAPSPTPGK